MALGAEAPHVAVDDAPAALGLAGACPAADPREVRASRADPREDRRGVRAGVEIVAEQGRVMCIALHPYWVGQPHRIRIFRQALEYILSHSGVWLARGHEIVDWFNAHHRPAIDAHLAAREAANG